MSRRRPTCLILACCALVAACGGSTHSATSQAVAVQTAAQQSTSTGATTASSRPATTRTSSTQTATSPATTSPANAPTTPAGQPLRVIETMHITGSRDGYVLEAGTVRGTPIGSGTLTVRAQLAASGAVVSFTVHGAHGSVAGIARMHLRFRRRTILYDGTARIVGGSGSYRRVRASGLTVTGSGDLAGTHTVLQVTGTEYD